MLIQYYLLGLEEALDLIQEPLGLFSFLVNLDCRGIHFFRLFHFLVGMSLTWYKVLDVWVFYL